MTNNKRKEERYPCVHLSVLYSPVTDSNVTNLADSYLHASSHDISISGMSFDVTTELSIGSRLMVAVPNDNDAHDEISAIVRWCKPIGEGQYRLGVSFDVDAGINRNPKLTDSLPVLHGPGIPVEARLFCPACGALSMFTYKAMQKCMDGTELPLYDCGSCGTTRSITSLLGYNRK